MWLFFFNVKNNRWYCCFKLKFKTIIINSGFGKYNFKFKVKTIVIIYGLKQKINKMELNVL